MSVTRRIFLGGTAVAAIGAPIPAADACEQPAPTRRELALWHMRELERLAHADGGHDVTVFVFAFYGSGTDDGRSLMLRGTGLLVDPDAMFAPEGGAA